MSILIHGLDMPKDGEQLCIDINPDGRVCRNLDLTCKTVASATSVPTYYRMIDASELKTRLVFGEDFEDESSETLRKVLNVIDDMSFVIYTEDQNDFVNS